MTNTDLQYRFKFDRYQWLKVIVINILIAITLSLINDHGFWINLLYSQAIGLSINTALSILFLVKQDQALSFPGLATAIITGVIIGSTFATLVSKNYQTVDVQDRHWLIISSLLYSIIIGCIVSYYFFLVAKQKEISNQLTVEKLKQAEINRALVESNLKVLQAQIEPHFLFNTLSNVIGLIDHRPEDAKKMLEHFTHYLRSGLSRTREPDSTLGDEIAIVEAYLNIQKIRMGDRLDFKIVIADELSALPFPPLLIQPLVENSIRHGLELEIDGGEVMVIVEQQNDLLTIVVSDTGKGAEDMQSDGIGVENIKQRLRSIFQDSATLNVQQNKPRGLIVTLQIPLEKP